MKIILDTGTVGIEDDEMTNAFNNHGRYRAIKKVLTAHKEAESDEALKGGGDEGA